MSKTELLTRAVSEIVPQEVADKKLASGTKMRVYLGIDPTGSKLHLGHSVPLRKLKQFADAGHHAIFLVGSFTAMIGDPTGRDAMREVLTKEKIKENFRTYQEQAGKILDFSKIEVRYNDEWLAKMSIPDIMQLASHFTVQQMLQRDMFKKRMSYKATCPNCKEIFPAFRSLDVSVDAVSGKLWPVQCPKCSHEFQPKKEELLPDEPISPNEFLYPLMQGYDSVALDVDCEIGGNDQLFNMLCGRKLQKAFGKRDKFVLTTKLIEGTDGRKMSKTYENCIYLEDGPSDMYGKILSMKDELITIYMECCTDIPMEEVEEATKAMNKGANPKDLKMRLAREIVTMYHGTDAAKKAEEEFQSVFAEKGIPTDIPEVKVKKGTLLVDVLVAEKLVPSKSEFRRLIEQKGIHVNEETVTAVDAVAEKGIVKVGKRKFLRIVV